MDTRAPDTTEHDLAALSDPDLIKRWAALRFELLRTPRNAPEWDGAKAGYDAVMSEYRRRIEGRAS